MSDIDPTNRRYRLKCKSKFFRKTVKDQVKADKVIESERLLVLLVPEESDQRTQFLMAWLPDTRDYYHEVVGYIKSPIDSPCRFSVHRAPDEKSERHYIFVMSKGVEDILVTLREGSSFDVEIFGAQEDEEADNMIDSDVAHELVE